MLTDKRVRPWLRNPPLLAKGLSSSQLLETDFGFDDPLFDGQGLVKLTLPFITGKNVLGSLGLSSLLSSDKYVWCRFDSPFLQFWESEKEDESRPLLALHLLKDVHDISPSRNSQFDLEILTTSSKTPYSIHCASHEERGEWLSFLRMRRAQLLNPPRGSEGAIEDPQFLEINNDELEDKAHELGKGGYGTVRLAIYRKLAAVVAVKTFLHQPEANADPRDDPFLKEFTNLSRVCNHENIVRLIGYCLKPRSLIMQYMSNGSLDDAISSPSNPLSDKLRLHRILMDVARGLEYIHACGLIHRDIKPQNILLSEDWRAKICDLGISRKHAGSENTFSGGMTYQYAAPEYIAMTDFDYSIDIYAYGIILWRLYSKKRPWEGLHMFRIYEKVKAGERPPEEAVLPQMSSAMVALMKDCWSAAAVRRPKASELLERLLRMTPESL